MDAGVGLDVCISWVKAFFGHKYVSVDDFKPELSVSNRETYVNDDSPPLLAVDEGVRFSPRASALDLSSQFVRSSDLGIHRVAYSDTGTRVMHVMNVLSHEECDALISGRRGRLVPSTTVNDIDSEQLLNLDRDRLSKGSYYDRGSTAVVSSIEKRLANVFSFPEENGEPIQILNYCEGGEYKPHFDFFEADNPAGRYSISALGGNRVATMIMYLNDVQGGGETIFPEYNLKITPTKGSVLYFDYLALDGSLDRMSLHGGLPVSGGEKWIATKWVRELPWG